MAEPSRTDDSHKTKITVDHLLRLARPGGDGCLIWTAGLSACGRPMFRAEGRPFSIAVHIYTALNGPLENKHWVVEPKCANIRCIAPEHLRMTKKSSAIRRLVGVPLKRGETLESAGYLLVHRKRGPSVWEPPDIARAVWAAQYKHVCFVCDAFIQRSSSVHCSDACRRIRTAAKQRRLQGRSRPGDERYRIEDGDCNPHIL